ncbi:MAG: DUF2061 domain-containing protein [Leptospiraceae bacterium]|nr:DUF2061 domain-containing protein [Leptospiraceae bacterium]
MLKTLTYCIMHMSVAITVVYLLSGSWVIATGIGMVEPLVQTVFYHLHERLWKSAETTPGGREDISNAGTTLAYAR